MFCNDRGIAILKDYEKLRLTAYLDSGGRPTIGWGTAHPWVKLGMTCTEDQANNWFKQDVDAVSAGLTRMIKVAIGSNKFSALVCWAYNVGLGNASTSTLIALLNKGEYDEVPIQLARWNKVNGAVVLGLVYRRNAEIDLWNMPDVV